MSKRPNIILTVADDQRYDTLGCLGHSPIQTPHLDGLAQRGTCFTNAYLPGSNHGAVCAPSRAQLHTGRSLFHTSDSMCAVSCGSLHRPASDTPLPTLGQLLGEAGYTTFGTGKWHNEEASFIRSFTFGQRVMFGGMSSHYCVPNVNYEPHTQGKKSHASVSGHSTDIFSDAAVDFLRSRSLDHETPFFLYCAFTAPHDPRQTVWHWRKQYTDDRVDLPPNFMPEHPFDLDCRRVRDEMLAEYPRTEGEIRRHIADYYAIISHLDEGIGRIHAALDELGMTDNTIVAHTADHGIAIGQHGLMGKQNIYDHSIHMPLLAAGPGFEADKQDDRLCYMQDLYPTLLEAAGVDVPQACDFQHLQSTSRRQTIGNAYGASQRTLREAHLKLNEFNVNNTRTTQLFDLHSDRHETVNLANQQGHADDVLRLRQAMRDWQKKMDDPSPIL